jgi:SAM-dependent methyltransferase
MAARGRRANARRARHVSPLSCRFCGAPLLISLVDLGLSPLSNALVEPSGLADREPLYPLHARVCAQCWLVQLPMTESPAKIFGDYAYFSSYSTTWLEHARVYALAAMERLALGEKSLVIEIASNDGYLLKNFMARGVPVLGIEPARNVAAAAGAAGVPTRMEFFGSAFARQLAAEGARADLLIANNVLAHVPELNDFVEGLRLALKPSGTLTLEFPHLLRMIERTEFDTIYHEHVSYFSLGTAMRVLHAHGLAVNDVEEIDTHGGSLRVHARHAGPADKPSARVNAVVEAEKRAGLESAYAYRAFAQDVARAKGEFVAFLTDAKHAGKTVAGYGAPAKATTLLNYAGVGTALLPYTTDRSPHKQGRYIPGVRVPIHPPERIFETKPDYVVIFPWNLKDEIVDQMSAIREWGGRFAVPIPRMSTI